FQRLLPAGRAAAPANLAIAQYLAMTGNGGGMWRIPPDWVALTFKSCRRFFLAVSYSFFNRFAGIIFAVSVLGFKTVGLMPRSELIRAHTKPSAQTCSHHLPAPDGRRKELHWDLPRFCGPDRAACINCRKYKTR